MTLAERCRRIQALILDVDGVLTEGTIHWASDAAEAKGFHVRDGSGMKAWLASGRKLGLLSGRNSAPTAIRAKELGIEADAVIQDRADKLVGLRKLLDHWRLSPEQVAYLGDDQPDLPVLAQVGLAAAVADACPEVVRQAHFVTLRPGGRGAARELIDLITRCQGLA